MEWQPEPKTRLAHIRHLEALAVIRSRKKVDAMRLELLNWLANRFGREVKAGHVIAFRFTYQTIAKVLEATRVTVAGALNQFAQSGDRPISMFVARAREV